MNKILYTDPEIALLLHGTASFQAGDRHRDTILRLLEQSPDLDWARILRLAAMNRVSSLLYLNLKQIAPSAAPAPILAELRQRYWNNSLWSLRLKAELLQIIRVFGEQGISVMPLKGPMLAAQHYDDSTQRESADLDILTPIKQIRRAEKTLRIMGYCATKGDTGPEQWFTAYFDFSFKNPETQVHVELHWKIARLRHPHYWQQDFLWQNARTTLFQNTPCLVPTTENLICFLCIHAFRHQWGRLQWICDICQIAKNETHIDWNRVIAQAKRLHCYRVVIFTLRLADELYGIWLPNEIRNMLSENWISDQQISQIIENLFIENKPCSVIDNLFLFDTASDVLRYELLHIAIRSLHRPTEKDFQWISLPPRMSFLHYLLRPFRWLRTYALPIGVRVGQRLGLKE